MLKRCLALFAMTCTVALTVASQSRAEDKPAPNDTTSLKTELKKLKHERVDTAVRAVTTSKSAYNAGVIFVESYLSAIEKLAEARLAVAESSEARVRACEESVTAIQELLESFKLSSHGPSPNVFETTQRALQSAQIAVLEEKLRQAAATPR